MNGNGGGRIKKLLGIDGKMQRGNATANQKGNHIVSAVDDRGHIVTIDAMGCQTDIAPLAGLTELSTLTLTDNPITDWTPVSHVYEVIGHP